MKEVMVTATCSDYTSSTASHKLWSLSITISPLSMCYWI